MSAERFCSRLNQTSPQLSHGLTLSGFSVSEEEIVVAVKAHMHDRQETRTSDRQGQG